jgi:hypothetical protein
VVLPPEFVPVIVYVVVGTAVEGVPEIIPIIAFRIKPAGSDGFTVYVVIGDPVFVGFKGDIDEPTE